MGMGIVDQDLNDGNSAKILGADGTTVIGNSGDRLKLTDGLVEGGTQGSILLTNANTAYEAKVGASRLPNRRSLTITAMDTMYWGYNSSVTTSSGTPLYKDQQLIFAVDPSSSFQIWLVSPSSGKSARITESP